ncbi:MAG: hypothetical protein EOO46_22870 [Flavobacterium sp.]|nr:MAG: hypothetical protein EOO46_22870 [Flavobacterium sp.]
MKFTSKLGNASEKIEAEGKIQIENSLPVLLGKASEGSQLFVSFLEYIDQQIKTLYESVPDNLKTRTIGLFKRLFSEFDIKEQHKPNPTYLNGFSEILTANKLIESRAYALLDIEEPLGNGKNADFTLIKDGGSEKSYVEVVNIHIDASKVENIEGFTQFVNHRLQIKYDDKTNGLSDEMKKRFHLSPCIWVDDSAAHHIEAYGNASPLKELGVLPPSSLVQYDNGVQKGFRFGIIKADEL